METVSGTIAKLFARGSGAGDPIVLAGEPASLQADIWLHNDGKEDLLLRRAKVISPELQRYTKQPEVARISVPRVLGAQQRKLLSVNIDIDPSIPPGSYDAEIRLEGSDSSQGFPARLIVTQNYQLSLDPEEFVFATGAATSISSELLVRNEGNVPVEVTPMGECQLKDPERRESCLSRSAAEELKEKKEEEDWFGVLRITNTEVVVQPGTWAAVKFTLHLPDSLPANAHLRARPRVGNERFNIDLLTPSRKDLLKKHSSSMSK
jgi:hypothetical protein